MKKLIIAEKPSLAMNIANAIDNKSFAHKDGYLENPDYIVSWAFGHLLGLQDIEEYSLDYDSNEKAAWSLDNLPFYPKEFVFRLKKDSHTGKTDTGIKRQFCCLKKLAERHDVDQIIHAGDADREGEVIIRNIISRIDCGKPVKRLWCKFRRFRSICTEI
ncbi:MAG: toprim domain-containing protein [Anaerovoracaceae bacterium]